MLRRNARLRREYLYRKSLEGKEKEVYEQKRKIKKALEVRRAGAPSYKRAPARRRPSMRRRDPAAPEASAPRRCQGDGTRLSLSSAGGQAHPHGAEETAPRAAEPGRAGR